MFGGGAFQQQQQPQQPQQSSFGGFGQQQLGQSQNQQQQQQQQQQQPRPGFGSPFGGGQQQQFNQNGLGQSAYQQQQPQQSQQPQGMSGYGQRQQFGQSLQSNPQGQPGQSFNPQQSYGQQPPQQQQMQQQPWANQSMPGGFNNSVHPQQSSQYGHQQQFQQPPMQQAYVPGYLSQIRGQQRPYSASASRKASAGQVSPPRGDDAAAGSSGSANAAAGGSSGAAGGPGSFSTPAGRHSREGTRRSSLDGPGSPEQGFSSAFFSSPGRQDSHAASRPFDGSGSIFGAGGLRGGTGNRNRASVYGRSMNGRDESSAAGTPARNRSSSFMRSMSVGSPPSQAGPSGNDVLDDDAPPSEALADEDTSRMDYATSFSESAKVMATSPLAGQAASSVASRQAAQYGGLTPSSGSAAATENGSGDARFRTLLVFGFPSSLNQTIISHFSSVGEVISSSSILAGNDSGSNAMSDCLRIIYAEPWHALRALRRNGEMVAGIAYVGVRWADESLHQEMILHGISSSTFSDGNASNSLGPSAPSPAPFDASNSSRPKSLSTSGEVSRSSASNNSTGTGTGAGARSARDSTPLFGRPINIVDSPAAALRARAPATAAGAPGSGTSSPLSKAMGLFGGGGGSGSNTAAAGTPSKAAPSTAAGGPGTPGNNSGMLSRVGDAIFGW